MSLCFVPIKFKPIFPTDLLSSLSKNFFLKQKLISLQIFKHDQVQIFDLRQTINHELSRNTHDLARYNKLYSR